MKVPKSVVLPCRLTVAKNKAERTRGTRGSNANGTKTVYEKTETKEILGGVVESKSNSFF